MQLKLQSFIDLKNQKSIRMTNHDFNYLLNDYLFTFYSNDIHQMINEHQNSNKIIVIGEYKDNDDFGYVFCLDNILLLIHQSDIINLSTFFSNNRDSVIYFISSNVENSIKQFKKNGCPDFLNFCLNEKMLKFILSKGISSFLNYFSIYIQKNANTKTIIEQANKFWEIINEFFAGYLILKTFLKTNFDRYKLFSNKDLSNSTNQIKIIKKDIIKLCTISNGTSSFIEMIYHIKTEQIFAVKLFIESTDKLFQREKSNYLLLHHPFLLRYYGIIEDEQNNNLIIEYINGENLFEIDKMKLSFSCKLKIIFEILTVMKYLHDNEFVYRDLKPNNIIIDQNKTAVLIDYDRMVKFDEMTKNFFHEFVAPEILLGTSYSYKSDVYSLGILLYFIIFEKTPEFNSNHNAINVDKNNFPLEYNKLIEIITQCTQKKPDKRPTISNVFTMYLDNYFDQILPYYCENIKKKKLFLKIAAKQNHAEAQFLLASIYIDGEEPENLIKFLKYLRMAASNNHSLAQYNIGKILHDGIIFTQDIDSAIFFYELASKQNIVEANFQLGEIYLKEKEYFDVSKAIYYYDLAANQNHSIALRKLGKLYYFNKYIARDIQKSIDYFLIAANKNDVDSQYILGSIYLEGKYVPKDINKAIKYFSLAANQNDECSLYNLGMIYLKGESISQNIHKAIHYLSLSANLNDSQAQYELGLLYLKNNDIQKAIHYLTLSANQSNVGALYKLGLFYYDKTNPMHDINKAIKYFTLAAEKNNPNSQHNLGVIFSDGIDVLKDINKSIYYYTLAANNNFCSSQLNLGKIYFEGKYVPKDIDKTIYYFTLAANQNSPQAQYTLGCLYYFGDDIHVDINKAIHYLTLASNQNNALAQYNLGNIFYYGKYIQRDINKAIHYYSLASNNQHSESQLHLGNMYFNGKYVSKNVEKGIYYYSLAAKLNNSRAQNTLGEIFYTGEEAIKDIPRAIYYYSLAAKNNDSFAQNNLAIIYDEGKYVSRDFNKAFNLYQLAANQNHCTSLYNLGRIYFEGKDIPQDINKAIYYFKLASNQNESISQCILGYIYGSTKYNHYDLNKACYYFTLSSKKENSMAQYFLGIYFYKTGKNKYEIDKSVNLLIQSSKNRFKLAHFSLGFLYHYGANVEHDIKKAVSFYKEASSFGIQYAKNNLGVIYRNGFNNEIEKRIGQAIEYFQEAIRQSDDLLSMYNLALVYIYEMKTEEYIEKSIDLLIKSANKGFSLSLELLCIILVQKVGYKMSDIEKEMAKHSGISSDFLFKMNTVINNKKLYFPVFLLQGYKFYQFNDYIYDYNKCQISIKNVNAKESNPIETNHKIQNITSSFYEGFGYDLL